MPPDEHRRGYDQRADQSTRGEDGNDPATTGSASTGSVSAGSESAGVWQEQFVSLLTAEQLGLHRYILTLLGDFDAASNVLQETNLVLWRKLGEFEAGTSFSAWARKVAYWQTLAYLRDRKRDKLVFSEELVKQIAARSALESDVSETRVALRHCLAELSSKHLELIKQRYGGNLSIDKLADKVGDQPGTVKVRLHRIRRALQNCIEKQMKPSP